MCEVLRVHDNIFLALGNEGESNEVCDGWQNAQLVLPSDLLPESATRFGPMHMERIHEFCTRLGDASEDTDGQLEETVVVVCAGGSDAESITDASMLVGSFFILWRGLSVQAVVEAFEHVNDQFVAYPNPEISTA
jgi:hypothetical protein